MAANNESDRLPERNGSCEEGLAVEYEGSAIGKEHA